MTPRVRRLLIIGMAAVLVVAAGVVIAFNVVRNRVNSVPSADLFGDHSTSASPSGSPSASPSASPTPEPGADIKGPLNILISGVDTRESIPGWVPHSDADMILHVSADLKSATLFSLPRDLVVPVPAFAPSHFGGETTKLTHAMTFGSMTGKTPSYVTGFQLLAQTVSNYTGIQHFDAGAVLTFRGLAGLVNSIGGIDVYVDQTVVSIHKRPDGQPRTANPSAAHGFSGPQMTYHVGMMHMVGWQALDFSRQRYLPGGDYTRQRHQRQVIKAIIAKAFSADIVTDPIKFNRVITALGKTLTFDGRGHQLFDFAYALRGLNTGSITLVGLPGEGVYSGGAYQGERLDSVAKPFLAAVVNDTVPAFLATHKNLINSSPAA